MGVFIEIYRRGGESEREGGRGGEGGGRCPRVRPKHAKIRKKTKFEGAIHA